LTLSIALLPQCGSTPKKLWTAFLFFIVYSSFTAVRAQHLTFNIKYYDAGSGFLSGNIRQILQDPFGYIWIATQDGLFRYDSRRFISYNTKYTNFQQIGGADVRSMQVDKENNLLWLSSSYGGINAIDLLTTKVVRHLPQEAHPQLYNNLIKTFYVSEKNIFLGCERGLFRLDRSGKKLVSIPLPGMRPDDTYIDYISEIEKNKMVILCRDVGIFIYDVSENTFVQKMLIKPPAGAPSELRFFHCALSPKGIMLIPSSYGLLSYKVQKGRLMSDSSGMLNRKLQALNKYTVRRAIFDKNDDLWLATSEGLYVIRNNTLTPIRSNDERNENVEWLKAVYALYSDMHSNVWLGCQNGLAYLRNFSPPFLSHSYSAETGVKIIHAYYLFPVNDSIIYSTAEEGLYRINKNRNTIDTVKRGMTYDFMCKDPFGEWIVSNREGLFVFRNGKEIPIASIYTEFAGFVKTRINSCIKMNDSCVAMGSENRNGVLVWNYRKRSVDHFSTKTAVKLIEDVVNNVYLLNQHELLILSDASLSILNYKNRTVKRLLNDLSTQTPANIFFDACRLKDTLFIACYGRGILKLDKDFRLIREINVSNGLSNNGVYKLLPWKDSVLFITTNFGLNIYHANDGRIRSFYKEDGLHDNAFEETSGIVFGEEIMAGGTNGFTTISPGKMFTDTRAPILYISGISVERPNSVIKDTANILISKYAIPSDAHQTTIYFSGLSYENPEKTSFYYKIDGIHQNWISLGNQNFIDLVPLSPGIYKMHVQAFDTYGNASEIREVLLNFLPKWYETAWLRLLVVLLIIAAAYALYHVRVNQLKKEHRIRSKLASDLHDDLGSTMNSVKVYANLSLIEKTDKHLLKIKTCTEEAIIGIRDIIWVLDASKDDVESLFARINAFAGPLCDANKIRFSVIIADDARYYRLKQDEKRNLYMMLKEAVNNAIKYSSATEIKLIAGTINKKLEIQVSDNGKGFDAEQFNEGNGLKNMRQRTKEIKYYIHVQSAPFSGTNIFFKRK
jgi:signal transduction histidine kinase/ligand-binding sensor domain-containing protein